MPQELTTALEAPAQAGDMGAGGQAMVEIRRLLSTNLSKGYFSYIKVISGLYRGYIGIMEKKMETTIMGYIGHILTPKPKNCPAAEFRLLAGPLVVSWWLLLTFLGMCRLYAYAV